MSDSTTFGLTGHIDTFTAPSAGLYRIEAIGAVGGYSQPPNNYGTSGGSGADVSGVFELTAGETLSIVVGGHGNSYPSWENENDIGQGATGGGGGSFVAGPGNTPLVVAGGGGGVGNSYSGNPGLDATGIETSGGLGGNFGGFADPKHYLQGGGGGGGFYGDGNPSPQYEIYLLGDVPFGGSAFVNGAGQGVAAGNVNSEYAHAGGDGGFGGGGAGGDNGGGGGYTGGDGSGSQQPGHGGSSYDAGQDQQFSLTGKSYAADSSVTIAPVSAGSSPSADPPIVGTPENDTSSGGSGNDQILVGKGNDVASCGHGRDHLDHGETYDRTRDVAWANSFADPDNRAGGLTAAEIADRAVTCRPAVSAPAVTGAGQDDNDGCTVPPSSLSSSVLLGSQAPHFFLHSAGDPPLTVADFTLDHDLIELSGYTNGTNGGTLNYSQIDTNQNGILDPHDADVSLDGNGYLVLNLSGFGGVSDDTVTFGGNQTLQMQQIVID